MDARALEQARRLAWLAAHVPVEARIPFASPAALARRERAHVRAAVAHAQAHVPFYAEALRARGLRPRDFRSGADLARLPLVGRAEVQADPERFVSRAQPTSAYWPMTTGGSSGAPLTVLSDERSLVRRKAYHVRASSSYLRAAGRPVAPRVLSFGIPDRLAGSPAERGLVRRASHLVVERHHASIFEPMERVVEAIERVRPHVVASHGSFLEALVVHLQASGGLRHRPGLLLWDSDAMSPQAQRAAREQLGIAVRSTYGAYEAPDFGFDCAQQAGYHVNADLYPFRVVDADGRPVPVGQPGEVVVSNLVNRGTVLLNYRLGDLAVAVDGPCGCGRTLPRLSALQGRCSDWLVRRDGAPLHPVVVYMALDFVPGLLRYQVLQHVPGEVEVRAVVAATADRAAVRAAIVAGFAAAAGADVLVTVTFVADFPRSAAGKVRVVLGLRP